jgi:hypothetical protein
MVNRNNLSKRNSRQLKRRQSRKSRNQRGGNNVEVLIYINLKKSESDEIITRKLTFSELWNVQAELEETFSIWKEPREKGVEVSNLLKSLVKYEVEQLPSPYKKFHFVIKLTMSETDANQLLNKETLDSIIFDMADAATISFDQGTDYSGNLLSNDRNKYYLTEEYELVGAGSPSVAAAAAAVDVNVDVAAAPLPKLAPVRASVSKKAPTPAQLRRAAAKAAGVKYVPVKSANVPKGCIQQDYVITNKLGTTYSVSRCLDSYDPNLNDSTKCMVNPETNKCKRVSRD